MPRSCPAPSMRTLSRPFPRRRRRSELPLSAVPWPKANSGRPLPPPGRPASRGIASAKQWGPAAKQRGRSTAPWLAERSRSPPVTDPFAGCGGCAACRRVWFSRQYGVVLIPSGSADQDTLPFTVLDGELSALRDQVVRLRAENARLMRLLELTPQQARPPGPVQMGVFDGTAEPVTAGSPAAAKVAFFAGLFAARTDVYALRWENARTGRRGWVPAVRGGWRKGVPAADRRGHHRAPVWRAGAGPVSAAGRRPLPVAGRRLRRPGRHAGCARLPQGRPHGRHIRGTGGVPLRSRRPCLAVLHRTRPRGHRPPGRHRSTARGDLRTRADGRDQL